MSDRWALRTKLSSVHRSRSNHSKCGLSFVLSSEATLVTGRPRLSHFLARSRTYPAGARFLALGRWNRIAGAVLLRWSGWRIGAYSVGAVVDISVADSILQSQNAVNRWRESREGKARLQPSKCTRDGRARGGERSAIPCLMSGRALAFPVLPEALLQENTNSRARRRC
jgi:hypothetical protein